MTTHNSPLGYRIVAALPWPAEGMGTNTVQREILAASLEGRVVAPEALADIVHELGAQLVNPMTGTLSDGVVWIKAPPAMKVVNLLPTIEGRAPHKDDLFG